MKILERALTILLSAISIGVWAGALSLPETQMVSYIDKHQAGQLSLLEKLVNINSGTNNIAGVKKVGNLLKKEFDRLGFQTRWVEEPASLNRAPTLVARREGKSGQRVLLIGHLDTVFPKNSPFQKFERKGDRATGPGIIDDKGGDVVILYALKAMDDAKVLHDATITVVLTGDEEDSGKPTSISRKPLFAAAKQSDIALDFECAITRDTATIARRGISMWVLETQGIEAHSAEIFHKPVGDGAVFELARILDNMREALSMEKNLAFNPGLIAGGTRTTLDDSKSFARAWGKENVIAKTALATGDLRFLTPEQETSARERMQAIVNKTLPGTKARIRFQDGIPSMPPSEGNFVLLNKYSLASEDLGFGKIGPLRPGVRGAGDISHIASMVSASLAGLGPMGGDAHAIGESLKIDSLPVQTKRAAILIYRLTHNIN